MKSKEAQRIAMSQGAASIIASILIGIKFGPLMGLIAFFVIHALMPIVPDPKD